MDEAKNMALLFFMDHLMQKNGRRTIHDLSCQFGARGFTQAMRDAVGTTQEGLTDFLSQFPSLFTVEADKVILKGFGEMDGKNQLMKIPAANRQRDYEAEAVEFFEAKLQRFGPELQIKSLLGHRSQAAPEVRLVSGRHLRDFAEFLALQTDHFIVEGDRVRLKNMPEPRGEEADELDDEGKPLAGIKAKQAAVDFLKGVLEQNEDNPIPLDAFYKRFCERFSHSVRQEVATNPKELLQFLKLNRQIFFIRSNKVSLVKNREENGSESGRSSTASAADSAGVDNNNVLFPLTRENLHRIQLVNALKPAQEVISLIFNDLDIQRSGEKFVGIDFKLVSLGGSISSQAEEFLSMIVVASSNRIAVFDLAQSDSILMESGLKQLLEMELVLKVVHDVRRVATLLAQRYAVNMRNVFDTQIAHSIIQHDKLNKNVSELRAISFLNLQRVYYPQSLMMSDVTPRKLSITPNWGQRPITPEILLSAAEECHCLVTALYRLLGSQLPESHRKMFEEKCLEALVANSSKPPPLISPMNGGGPQWSMDALNRNAYRPPASRRSVFGTANAPNSLLNFGPNGYIPPPLRKASAPPTSLFATGNNNNHNNNNNEAAFKPAAKPKMVDSATQTISTGEITVLEFYYDN